VLSPKAPWKSIGQKSKCYKMLRTNSRRSPLMCASVCSNHLVIWLHSPCISPCLAFCLTSRWTSCTPFKAEKMNDIALPTRSRKYH
jgi:hypothetical protein